MGLSKQPGGHPWRAAVVGPGGLSDSTATSQDSHPHCTLFMAGVQWYGRVLHRRFGRKRGVCGASSFETFLGTYLQEVGIRSITDSSSPLVAQAQKAKEPTESVLGSPSLGVSRNLPSVCRIWVLFALRQ